MKMARYDGEVVSVFGKDVMVKYIGRSLTGAPQVTNVELSGEYLKYIKVLS